jgi:hypothetical protein
MRKAILKVQSALSASFVLKSAIRCLEVMAAVPSALAAFLRSLTVHLRAVKSINFNQTFVQHLLM